MPWRRRQVPAHAVSSARTSRTDGADSRSTAGALSGIAASAISRSASNMRCFTGSDRGSILSASAEIMLPTGKEKRFGAGDGVRAVPHFRPDPSPRRFPPGASGRRDCRRPTERATSSSGAASSARASRRAGPDAWSPMVELLAAKERTGDRCGTCSAAPRHAQHTSAHHGHAGVRVSRSAAETGPLVAMNFLWDRFDGGLFDGW